MELGQIILANIDPEEIQRMGYIYAFASISSIVSVIGGTWSTVITEMVTTVMGEFGARIFVVIFGTIGTLLSLLVSFSNGLERFDRLLLFCLITFFNGFCLAPIYTMITSRQTFQTFTCTIVLSLCFSFPIIVLLSFLIEKKVSTRLREGGFSWRNF